MKPGARVVLALGVAALLGACSTSEAVIEVWKTSACGCCKDWVKHLQANGFEVRVNDVEEPAVYRRKFGISNQFGSCHTARVAGYGLEGHVPAAEIRRLLRERPEALGLAVPAMPVGSPGMDGPDYGSRKDPYDVLLLAQKGAPTIYQSYR